MEILARRSGSKRFGPYLGKIKGGAVILDEPGALPDGTVVRLEPVEEAEASHGGESLAQMLRRLSGIAKGLPPDLARNHDHYLHGLPEK